MWIDRLLSTRTTEAARLAAVFAEHRQRILAENVANLDTPDYLARDLDPKAFQHSLQEALQRTAGDDRAALELRGNAQFQTTRSGEIVVKPAVEPAGNVLFHDGTNVRLENLMAGVLENSLYYEMSTGLLRKRFNGLLAAIRGRLT